MLLLRAYRQRGTNEYNLALGERRPTAHSVLKNSGMNAQDLNLVSYVKSGLWQVQ
jgi:outer membrane protein OmpA-like peptidoglycan-associated protein